MDVNILLVEDDLNLGFVISDQLKSKNYNVSLAIDGVDGFKRFNEKQFHLCILDVMMPKKDGFSLAQDIRKLNQEVPILFLTAKADTDDRVKGFHSGGDDYLTKPFSLEEFMLRVKSLLKRSGGILTDSFPTKFQIGSYTFDYQNFELIAEGFEKKLTKKEAEILNLLYKYKGQVLPRGIVLNAIWGKDDYFVGRSLDVFITKLRKYFSNDDSITITNIHGVGFKLDCAE